MKITYIGNKDLKYITNRNVYMFTKTNNYTIDVTKYEDIYTMIRDSRFGTSFKLEKDPSINSLSNHKKPGIVSMSATQNNKNNNKVIITTETASGKNKVQEVKDFDSELASLTDEELTKTDVKDIIKEATTKIESVKKDTVKTTKKKTTKSKK